MSTRFRLTRRSASRILDDPTALGGLPLTSVLAAASAPAEAGELPGEMQALAQFAAGTSRIPTTAPGGTPVMSRIRKLVTAPAALAAATGLVVAGGGLALAASQGALHAPFQGHDHRSDHAPSAPASTNPGLSRTDSPSGEPSDTATPTATHTPSGTPSPSLEGLCHAFQAGAMSHNHANPAFAALTKAAGGTANIATYCVGLIGPSHKPSTPVTPTHPAKPTQAPTSHPSTPSRQGNPPTTPPGRPTSLPTPTSHPTPPAH